MTLRLQDKVAIVTGAGAVGPGWGNGRSTAMRFAEEGAKLFAVDRDAERLRETVDRVKKAGGAIAAHLCDVSAAVLVAWSLVGLGLADDPGRDRQFGSRPNTLSSVCVPT